MFFILDIINYFNIGLMGPGKKNQISSTFWSVVWMKYVHIASIFHLVLKQTCCSKLQLLP